MIAGTLDDIREKASKAKGKVKWITGHWSAGKWNPNHIDLADYHILVLRDGSYLIRDDFAEKLAHTWQRNTGNIGIAFAGCFGATTSDLGEYAPTEEQISAMAAAVKAICEELGESVDIFKTHAEWADEDDYGPATTCERWDLWFLRNGDPHGSGGDEIRRLAA
jgi:hypothetical protein